MSTTDARVVAARLAAQHDEAWLLDLIRELERGLGAHRLTCLMRRWQLSSSELGQLFNVSRQSISRWLVDGVPSARAETVADVQAIADLLDHYVQANRIPAVIRRKAPGLGGQSLIELIADGRSGEALRLTRTMFAMTDVRG